MSVIWALFIQFYVEKDLVQVGNNKADGEKPDLFFLSRVPLMKVTCLMCQVTWEQHLMHPVCHRTQGRLSGCSISQPAVKASFPRMFACWELLDSCSEKLMRCVFQLLVRWIPISTASYCEAATQSNENLTYDYFCKKQNGF